jgi:hypothetical protein
MTLPTDITAKLNADFSDSDDRKLVQSILEDLEGNENHRIMRCILYLANGDLKTFGIYSDLAQVDYRDVIMNAEYERPSNKRLRDFNKPF